MLSALNRGTRGERYILGGENVSYREIARRSLKAQRLRRHKFNAVSDVHRLRTDPTRSSLSSRSSDDFSTGITAAPQSWRRAKRS